jgi:tRNA1Val (adenine37-N6)-methyltransferase
MKLTTDSCLFGAWAAREVQQFTVQNLQLLDVGCGTGLLSLMVAQKNNIEIDAIEIDSEAAEQAKENIRASPWKERIRIINEDVLQWNPDKKYDRIISNPPFYEDDLKSNKKEKNVAHHSEGLRLKELLHFVKTHLTNDGVFYLLLPYKRLNDIESLLEDHNLRLHKKILVKQTTAHQPFRLMIQGAAYKSEKIKEERLTIKNVQQHYTPAFISLLKDYYLHL